MADEAARAEGFVVLASFENSHSAERSIASLGRHFRALSRKREADAIGLQSRLSDALLTDRALQSAIVTLTVHTPMWKRSPLIVEVRGDVPSAGLRDAVLRVVQREATQLKSNVEIEDKLLIVPPRTSRTA